MRTVTGIIAYFNLSSYTKPPHLSPHLFFLIPRVKHHNILQLVDAFETKKEYFIFLEL